MKWKLYQISLPASAAILNMLVSLLTLVSNLLVIITFKRMRNLQPQHYLMTGLCAADLITSVMHFVSTAVLIRGHVWLTIRVCYTMGMLTYTCAGVTVCIHSALCLEKCLSVRKPLVHRRLATSTKRNYIIIGVMAACYILPLILNLIPAITDDFTEFQFDPAFATCILNSSGLRFQTIFRSVLLILLPILIQLVTSILIVSKIRKLRGVTKQRTKRAIRTLVLTVGLFYLSWLPVLVYAVWMIIQPNSSGSDWSKYIISNIVASNSAMSFIIYIFTLPKFKITLFGAKNNPAVRPSGVSGHQQEDQNI